MGHDGSLVFDNPADYESGLEDWQLEQDDQQEKEQESPQKKQLVRDAKAAALLRMEDAARTEDDFRAVVKQWNQRDVNRLARERYHEVGRPNAMMLHWDKKNPNNEKGGIRVWLDTVIPPPFEGDVWWRQLLRGDFLDYIHDCPYEMHELTTSRPVMELLQALNDNQTEVLYYRTIRQETPQQIAAWRGQSDRNIRDVHTRLVEQLRRELYTKLAGRYKAKQPLTSAQKRFVEDCEAGRLKMARPKLAKEEKKTGKTRKKKPALDGNGGG